MKKELFFVAQVSWYYPPNVQVSGSLSWLMKKSLYTMGSFSCPIYYQSIYCWYETPSRIGSVQMIFLFIERGMNISGSWNAQLVFWGVLDYKMWLMFLRSRNLDDNSSPRRRWQEYYCFTPKNLMTASPKVLVSRSLSSSRRLSPLQVSLNTPTVFRLPIMQVFPKPHFVQWYCWRKKSCTTWHVRNHVKYDIFSISNG